MADRSDLIFPLLTHHHMPVFEPALMSANVKQEGEGSGLITKVTRVDDPVATFDFSADVDNRKRTSSELCAPPILKVAKVSLNGSYCIIVHAML